MSTLSFDQQVYADNVASQTGLDLGVVQAWVAQESGWGVTKGDNNYLNIGPGYSYPTVAQASTAAATLLNTSGYYAGIRQAIPGGPAAQIDAIAQSPWDAGHYGLPATNNLAATYDSMGTVTAVPTTGEAVAGAASATETGLLSSALGGIASLFFGSGWVNALFKGLLYIVFTVGGLALVVLGLARMFPGVTKTVTDVTKAAPLAAAA